MTTSHTMLRPMPALAAHRLAEMIEFTAQVTGVEALDLRVVVDAVTVPDVTNREGQVRTSYRADLRASDGVHYRVRLDDQVDTADWTPRLAVSVVTGYGRVENEIEVTGFVSHARAHRVAVNYERYVGTLTRS